MEELIRKELKEGERLLYTGKPKTVQVLDKTNKAAFIIKNVIAVVIAAVLSIGYAVYCSTSNTEPRSGLYVVMALIVVISVYTSFSDVSTLNKKVGYGLSDKRLFVSLGDSVKSVEFEKIPCVKIAKDDDGNENFLFGKSAIKLKPSAWRKTAVVAHLVDTESGLCEEFVMINPENGDKVKEIIKKYLTVM